jgi:signal transduction histidine kinase
LIYVAVIVRAIGWNQETAPIQTTIWLLLAIFGVVLFSQQMLTSRFPLYPRVYTLLQSGLVIAMLYSAPTLDFLPLLLLPLSFQAVAFFSDLVGFLWIGGFLLAMTGMIFFGLGWQAGLTMILTGVGEGFLMGSFAHLISRTENRRQQNQRLLIELQEAYHKLKFSAAQAEVLAAALERHRLVRELHDSLTQTLFSMNLAVQSAQLSIGEDTQQTIEHLTRLQILSRNAAGEVQSLIRQAPLYTLSQGGLAAAIQQLSDERLEQDGLQVTFEATGQRILSNTVASNLFRITQEALNNIIRHAGVRQASIQLHLESPIVSLDIVDEGCGFNPSNSMNSEGFGLIGMTERANEIGWMLAINSFPGKGTHIHVEEQIT